MTLAARVCACMDTYTQIHTHTQIKHREATATSTVPLLRYYKSYSGVYLEDISCSNRSVHFHANPFFIL